MKDGLLLLIMKILCLYYFGFNKLFQFTVTSEARNLSVAEVYVLVTLYVI